MRCLLRAAHYGSRRVEAGSPVPSDATPECVARWEGIGVLAPLPPPAPPAPAKKSDPGKPAPVPADVVAPGKEPRDDGGKPKRQRRPKED
jgi:hypothetical protein